LVALRLKDMALGMIDVGIGKSAFVQTVGKWRSRRRKSLHYVGKLYYPVSRAYDLVDPVSITNN